MADLPPIPTLGVLGSAGPIDEQPFADRTILALAFTPNDTEQNLHRSWREGIGVSLSASYTY